MLKLLKYEIIESYRQYLVTFVVFLLLCCLSPLMPSFISNILYILVFCALIGISIAIYLNIIISFNRSMYQRPGYLTMTLPVSTHQLLITKIIGSLIWVLVSSFVLLAGIVILILLVGEIPLPTFFNMTSEVLTLIQYNFKEFMQFLINYLVYVIVMILSFYFVITLTKTRFIIKYKTFSGIAIYLVGYIIISYLLNIINLDFTNLNILIIVGLILSCLFYIGTVYLINHEIEI